MIKVNGLNAKQNKNDGRGEQHPRERTSAVFLKMFLFLLFSFNHESGVRPACSSIKKNKKRDMSDTSDQRSVVKKVTGYREVVNIEGEGHTHDPIQQVHPTMENLM